MRKLAFAAAFLLVAALSPGQTILVVSDSGAAQGVPPIDPTASNEAGAVYHLRNVMGLTVDVMGVIDLTPTTADAYDAVLIFESIGSGSIVPSPGTDTDPTIFNSYTGPVMTMESFVLENLGLAEVGGSTDAIVTDPTMYSFGHANATHIKVVGDQMANGLPFGNVQLSVPSPITDPPPAILVNYSTTAPAGAIVTGTLVREDPPGPFVDDAGFACYFSVDQGATLVNGMGTAAGIRICHFEHNNFNSLDPDELNPNPDAIALWEGAVKYALGIDQPTPTPTSTPGPTPTPGPAAAANWEYYE